MQVSQLSTDLQILDWDWLEGTFLLPWEEFLELFTCITIAWVTESSEKYGKAQLRKSRKPADASFELSTDLGESGTSHTMIDNSQDQSSPPVTPPQMDVPVSPEHRGDLADLPGGRLPDSGSSRQDSEFNFAPEHARTHSKSSNYSVSSADTVLMEGIRRDFSLGGGSLLSVVQEGDNESQDPSVITSSSVRTRARYGPDSRSPSWSPVRQDRPSGRQDNEVARRQQAMELAEAVRAKVGNGRKSLIAAVARALLINEEDDHR